jgi:hypothetical protein
MLEKHKRVERYWGKSPPEKFSYGDIDPRSLAPFRGEHPPLMHEWIRDEAEWSFRPNPDYKVTPRERKHRILNKLRDTFGWDFSKRHYIPIDLD